MKYLSRFLRYIAWITIGMASGALVGLAIPVSLIFFVILVDPQNQGAAGWLLIFAIWTVPMGGVVGALVGGFRAHEGSWRQIHARGKNPRRLALLNLILLRRRFSELQAKLDEMDEQQANIEKGNYLKKLCQEYESIQPNIYYSIVPLIVFLITLLIIPIFAIWSLLFTVAILPQGIPVWVTKLSYKYHLRQVMAAWNIAAR